MLTFTIGLYAPALHICVNYTTITMTNCRLRYLFLWLSLCDAAIFSVSWTMYSVNFSLDLIMFPRNQLSLICWISSLLLKLLLLFLYFSDDQDFSFLYTCVSSVLLVSLSVLSYLFRGICLQVPNVVLHCNVYISAHTRTQAEAFSHYKKGANIYIHVLCEI